MIKKGGEGVLVATRGRDDDRGRRTWSRWSAGWAPATPSAAALAHGLLARWDPVDIAEHANAAGAIVASRLACADAMPTLAELDQLVARRTGEAVR